MPGLIIMPPLGAFFCNYLKCVILTLNKVQEESRKRSKIYNQLWGLCLVRKIHSIKIYHLTFSYLSFPGYFPASQFSLLPVRQSQAHRA